MRVPPRAQPSRSALRAARAALPCQWRRSCPISKRRWPVSARRSSGLTRTREAGTARLNDRIHRSAIKIMRPIISSVKSQIGTMGLARIRALDDLGADPRTRQGALIARTRGDVRHWPIAEALRGFSQGQLLDPEGDVAAAVCFVSHV